MGVYPQKKARFYTYICRNMMHFRLSTSSQLPAYQYAYGNKTASGVCLQNVFDYSPFGVTLDGRTMQGDGYRYGFGGHELDDEIKGDGNSYTTLFRQFDSRLGKAWTLDPKNQYPSPYVMFGNNPINGIDPDGAYFWENSNVRQARTFARQTGGEFNKWKGKDGRTYANVTINDKILETRSINADKTLINFKDYNIQTYLFKPEQNRSDLLMEFGVGFYKTQRASSSGWDRLTWAFKSGDAWVAGKGEYNRRGQAPDIAKALAGTNLLVSVPNAISILWNGVDIYGVEASTMMDQGFALAEITINGLFPITNLAKLTLVQSKSLSIIEIFNQTVQITNDFGGFNKLKELENKKNE